MSVQLTYFVHGTTTDNESHISSGWKDVELSALGMKQSQDLIQQLKGKSFDVVFCSDLKRAVQSAKITFGDNVIIDPRLRECNYGTFNGQLSELVEPMQEKSIYNKFPQGESYEDVKARMSSFLAEVKAKYDNKHIAIVAHKAPQLALDVLLKNQTWEQAFANDWRKVGKWQPGWEYVLNT